MPDVEVGESVEAAGDDGARGGARGVGVRTAGVVQAWVGHWITSLTLP